MSAAKEKWEETKNALKAAKDANKAALTIYFGEESGKLFAEYPMLEEFSWPQYTPYHNDGDQCEFGVYKDSPEINGKEVSNSRWDNTLRKSVPVDNPPWLVAAKNGVKEFLKQFKTADFKTLFGDHVKVVVNQNGVTTENYEHD